ncbi:P-II family nitrogen regulator [Candidatus Poribacteria bacterium]|nr:P-II family nitrogen regulator [Candidatus Poribacteria bacterium]
MKKIECIILPLKLAAVKKALRNMGVRNMRVSHGFGRGSAHIELYRVNGYPIEVDPRLLYRLNRYPMETDSKLKIEISVEEENVNTAVEAIKQAVAAGETA